MLTHMYKSSKDALNQYCLSLCASNVFLKLFKWLMVVICKLVEAFMKLQNYTENNTEILYI
jgi:hypothetical protein